MSRETSDEAPRHAIRRSRQVSEQVDQEWERLRVLTDEQTADSWQDGLLEAIADLADYPERCAVAVEDRLFPNAVLRQLVYQRRRGGPAWRVLFSVHPADANHPPTVRLHLIRHGAQAPMTEWPSLDEV